MPYVKDALEERFPKLFKKEQPKEQPLEPGLYRDKDGVVWMLAQDEDGYWRLLSPSGFAMFDGEYDYFDVAFDREIAELRTIMSKMMRVE